VTSNLRYSIEKFQNLKTTFMTNTIKIAIVDDKMIYRMGMKSVLQDKSDIEIVFEATNGLDLMNHLKNNEVNIIIMDLRMPIMDGLTALDKVSQIFPLTKVIMLLDYPDEENTDLISEIMSREAGTCLRKSCTCGEIYEAIKIISKDEYFCNTLVKNSLAEVLKKKNVAKDALQLKPSEEWFIKLLCADKKTQEIAKTMNLSIRSIPEVLRSIKEKTGHKSTAGIVMFAVKSGLVKLF